MEGDGGRKVGTGEDGEERDLKGANAGAAARRDGEVAGTGADDEVFAEWLNGNGAELAVIVFDGGGVGGFVVSGEVVVELVEGPF